LTLFDLELFRDDHDFCTSSSQRENVTILDVANQAINSFVYSHVTKRSMQKISMFTVKQVERQLISVVFFLR
jgi:hypothetical protein